MPKIWWRLIDESISKTSMAALMTMDKEAGKDYYVVVGRFDRGHPSCTALYCTLHFTALQ